MWHSTIYMVYTGIYHVWTELAQIQNVHTVFSNLTRTRCRLHVSSMRECTNIGKSPWNAKHHCMYIHLYALYIETCIISNMHIHVYAWYIAFRQGVGIPDEVKKTCADYDLAILRSYRGRYIPSYTKYNLVYTSFHWCWVCHTLGWFSNVWICAHTCPVIWHRNLESKVKKTCADYDLAILRSYLYIPSYTTYSMVHTEIYHPLLGIRHEPSCEPVLSRLPACAVHRLRHPSSPQSARWTGPQGGACHAQTATATGWLRRYCCPVVRPKQQRRHSQMGSLLPCACWTCEG